MTAPVETQGAKTLIVHEQGTQPDAIVRLLELAVEKAVPVEMLERLQALHERVSDRAAAAEFAHAVAEFQSRCPPITKTATAEIATKSGARFKYQYAELDHIARTIAPFLRELGLSYSWDSEMADKLMRVTCTLRHVNGHSTTASFACPVESLMGATEQQKHGAALTYARRQSLIQVLGLTTCDPDTDGANPEPITEQQAQDLDALIQELQVDKGRFLQWAGVSTLAEIPARNYGAAIKSVKAAAAAKARRQAGAS